jgi:hypothetical protein
VACPPPTSSDAQHEQCHNPNANEKYRERHGVVLKPMPNIGKHDLHPLFERYFFFGSDM